MSMDYLKGRAAPEPHSRSVFSLIPLNDRAKAVVEHPNNVHLLSVVNVDNPLAPGLHYGLNVGSHIRSRSKSTLASLGRNADIYVPGSDISRIHCAFEVHETSGGIMLQDYSSRRNTRIEGTDALSFDPWLPLRRILVAPKLNPQFSFGGRNEKAVSFYIHWHQSESVISTSLQHRTDASCDALTVDDNDTAPPSRAVTRIHTPGCQTRIRWWEKSHLGHGSFGRVCSALNVDSGEQFAVKIIKYREAQAQEHERVKREIEMLGCVTHEHIVAFMGAQPGPDGSWEIFTALKEGNVTELASVFEQTPQYLDTLLRSMLLALDYLHGQNIIHRDVKPENILWTPAKTSPSPYHFTLTDFGLSNFANSARTFAGSELYGAPELWNSHLGEQTTKMDIWSLFVTLLWLYGGTTRSDPCEEWESIGRRIDKLSQVVAHHPFDRLRDMVHVDPRKRASAGDILFRIYIIKGRTTRKRAHTPDVDTGKLPAKRPCQPVNSEKTLTVRVLRNMKRQPLDTGGALRRKRDFT